MFVHLRRIGFVLGLAALAACSSTVAPDGKRPPPRGPGGMASAAAYLADPLLSHVTLSPDGKQIAAVFARDGVSVLIVRPTWGGEIRRLAKLDEPGMALRTLGWGNDELILAGIDVPDQSGVRALRIMMVRLDGSTPRYLADAPRSSSAHLDDPVIDWLPDDLKHVLIHDWQPGQLGVSARFVNFESGAGRTAVPSTPGVWRWYADREGQVRAGEGSPRGTSWVVYARATGDGSFEKLVEFDRFGDDGFTFAGFSPNPQVLYVHATAPNRRTAVYEYDLAARTLSPPRVGDPRYDVGGLVQSRLTGKLLGVEVVRERPEFHFVDPAAQREQASIDRAFPGTTNRIVSLDRAEKIAIVSVSGDLKAPEYYVYDRAKKQMDFLFTAHPDLAKQPLAPMKTVRYAARNGLEIEAYLTLPPQGPATRLATIVMPHDGPTARDVWGWDATVQFLASRGFAVFQPNYRGSSGYGREHLRQGRGQWGAAIQDDLVDGVKWLVGQGIADPDRVGIYGVGYGGYAALMGLVKSPEGFRAGASRGGFTDLIAWLDDRDDYLYDDLNAPASGDSAARERLAAHSPAHHADRIRAPVLIAHGEEDPLVRVEQARAMADALEAAGSKPELYIYRDELHEFVDERNRIDFHEKLAAFFTRHLAPAPAR